mgnify:CR=1 FL=1
MSEDNITIPRYVYDSLMAESALLNALYSAGLTDGTYFYDRAIEILEEEGLTTSD